MNRSRVVLTRLVALLFLGLTGLASAELVVQITKGKDNAASIAVVPFTIDDSIINLDVISVDQIISGDLARSGQFSPLALEDMLSYPSNLEEVFYQDWRVLGVQYLVFGQVVSEGGGVFTTRFFLMDIVKESILFTDELPGTIDELRSTAHYISDTIYEHITGVPGAYSTKLLYISANRLTSGLLQYRLIFSDVDGANQNVLYQTTEPLLSPSWSPDGRKVAYVSFENGRGAVILQDLLSSRRQTVVELDGRSSSPAFSPDATKLALVLARRGNPDIYIKDLVSGKLQQMTKHYRIDTEPSWSPDGNGMVFTSNRSGSPQIYLLTLDPKKVARLTFEGDYNAKAQVLPDGRSMAFVHQKKGIFHIARMHFEHGDIQILTSTALDESPSISPNGMMLIYATQDLGKGILAVLSLDGNVKYNLPDTANSEVREPSWSPFFVATDYTEKEDGTLRLLPEK